MNTVILFVKECYEELAKVTWLTKKEVVASTIIVFVIVFLFSAYVSSIDFGLSYIIRALIGGR